MTIVGAAHGEAKAASDLDARHLRPGPDDRPGNGAAQPAPLSVLPAPTWSGLLRLGCAASDRRAAGPDDARERGAPVDTGYLRFEDDSGIAPCGHRVAGAEDVDTACLRGSSAWRPEGRSSSPLRAHGFRSRASGHRWAQACSPDPRPGGSDRDPRGDAEPLVTEGRDSRCVASPWRKCPGTRADPAESGLKRVNE